MYLLLHSSAVLLLCSRCVPSGQTAKCNVGVLAFADSSLLDQLLEKETQDILSVAEEELELEHEKLQAKEFEVQQYHARLCATRDIFFLRNEHVFRLVVTRNTLLDFMQLWKDTLANADAYRAHWACLMRILRERGRRKLQHGLLVEHWKSQNAVPTGKSRPQEPDKSDRRLDKKLLGKELKENLEQNR